MTELKEKEVLAEKTVKTSHHIRSNDRHNLPGCFTNTSPYYLLPSSRIVEGTGKVVKALVSYINTARK